MVSALLSLIRKKKIFLAKKYQDSQKENIYNSAESSLSNVSSATYTPQNTVQSNTPSIESPNIISKQVSNTNIDNIKFLNAEAAKLIVKCAKNKNHELVSPAGVVSIWAQDYIYQKEAINFWTSPSIKSSYIQIRRDFLNGIFYNLSIANYKNYAFVLYFDAMSALKKAGCTDEDIDDVSILFNFICSSLSDTISADIRLRHHMDADSQSNHEYVFNFNINRYFGSGEWEELARLGILGISSSDLKVISSLGYYYEEKSFHYNNLRTFAMALLLRVIKAQSRGDKYDTANNTSLMTLCIRQIYRLIANGDDSRIPSIERSSCGDAIRFFSEKGDEKIIQAKLEEMLPLPSEVLSDIYQSDEQFWKYTFSTIKDQMVHDEDICKFCSSTNQLYMSAKKCGNIHMLFADSVQFILPYDKTAALYYLLLGKLQKENLKVSKIILKQLLPQPTYVQKFDAIYEDYRNSKRVAQYELFEDFYKPERKKVSIAKEDLQQQAQKYQQTVNMLDKIMSEDDIIESDSHLLSQSSQKDTNLKANVKVSRLDYKEEIIKNFIENGYSLSNEQVASLAHNIGMMQSVMINSINEYYYEALDDNLIEEMDDTYTINQGYINTILNNE